MPYYNNVHGILLYGASSRKINTTKYIQIKSIYQMSKNVLFSAMLFLGAMGGVVCLPTPVMAATEQAQTFVVTGQVVDQDGEPLIGATI